MLDEHTARIRALNDKLRASLTGGRIQITRGIAAMGADVVTEAWRAVANFSDFTASNDPYGEHDFGAFSLCGSQIFFKIDYYDLSFEGAALDPADEATCARVLTIMLAEEY